MSDTMSDSDASRDREAVLSYVRLWNDTCASHKEPFISDTLVRQVVDPLANKNPAQVFREAKEGNAASIVDLSLRCVPELAGSLSSRERHGCWTSASRAFVGCGVPKDTDFPMQLLRILTADDNPLRASRLDRARGFALLAYGVSQSDPKPMHVGADYANRCAALGLVPPFILDVAREVEHYGGHDPTHVYRGFPSNPFTNMKDLFDAYDDSAREEQSARSTRPREKKVWENPNFFFCAREGCGLEATRKVGLRKCGGACKLEGKPAYCSPECQTKVSGKSLQNMAHLHIYAQDWPRHKPFCKSDAAVDSRVASIREQGRKTSVIIPGPEGYGVLWETDDLKPDRMRRMKKYLTILTNPGADVDIDPFDESEDDGEL